MASCPNAKKRLIPKSNCPSLKLLMKLPVTGGKLWPFKILSGYHHSDLSISDHSLQMVWNP